MENAVSDILARGASMWTSEEAKLVEKAIKEYGYETVRQQLINIRGGEKPNENDSSNNDNTSPVISDGEPADTVPSIQ